MKRIFFLAIALLSLDSCGFYHFRRPRVVLDPAGYTEPMDYSRLPDYSPNGSSREFALYLLKKYYPDGLYIIRRDEQMARNMGVRRLGNYGKLGFMVWMRSRGKSGVLRGIGTAVHEENHGFASKYGHRFLRRKLNRRHVRFHGYGYYIGDGRTIIVQKTGTFPARRIRDLFPQDFLEDRNLHFRFKTYVYPSGRYNSTQGSGIYGLMDEFNSYYHGCRVQIEMLPWYMRAWDAKPDPKEFIRYFHFASERYAYYEFKLYILLYMIRARQSYPRLYRAFLRNKPLLSTFFTVDKKYRKLFVRYRKMLRRMDSFLRKRGHFLEETDRSFYIKPLRRKPGTYTFTGRGHYHEVDEAYTKELAKPRYTSMEAIMRRALERKPVTNRNGSD